MQIETRARLRHGKAQNNFPATLPPEDSDMAAQVFKDPYLFDFLGTDAPRREKHLEQGLLAHPDDKPTLGLLLVREKNRVLVEYALGGSARLISVAEWETQLTRALPRELQGSLPTIEEIEAELSGDMGSGHG